MSALLILAAAAPGQYGANVVAESTFSTGFQWNEGVGWSISGGKANKAAGGGSLTQDLLYRHPPGTYEITFTIASWVGGGDGVYLQLRNTTGITATNGTVRSSNGTFTEVVSHGGTLDRVWINPTTGTATYTIDNVIVRRKYY